MKEHKLKFLPPHKIDLKYFIKELGEANQALGKLIGLLVNIPNPSLLTTPLLTKEAVASSKIEGTQATLEDVFKYEAAGKTSQDNIIEKDVREIINYRTAIHTAINLLKNKPIGENFIKKLHAVLLNSVRGENKDKGNFRRIPVFIGKPGATISDAIYVPPSINDLAGLISNWEKYVNDKDVDDLLIQTAVAHYQFEAIHPFMDGNGRIGRLLIPIILYDKNVLNYPLLYVSEYLEKHRNDYYYYLRKVDNEEAWEEWIKFFLISIKNQANDTMNKVIRMLELYKTVKEKLINFNSQYSIELLDIIFENPITSFKSIKTKINSNSNQTVYNLLDKFQEAEILFETTGAKRNKTYAFRELLSILK